MNPKIQYLAWQKKKRELLILCARIGYNP